VQKSNELQIILFLEESLFLCNSPSVSWHKAGLQFHSQCLCPHRQHWHCLSTPNAAHETSRRSQMLQIQKTFSPSTNTVKHQWMVTLSRMHFAAEWRTCQTSLNERMMFVQPIFHNVWLKSGSRNTFKSQFLFLIREKQVVFHEMVPLCMKQMMNSHNSHIQKKTALKPAKNYANWSNCCTDISNWI